MTILSTLKKSAQKAVGMDAEARNIDLLKELGIDPTFYDHQKYEKLLQSQNLEPFSVYKMNEDLPDHPLFHDVTKEFRKNSMHIQMDSRKDVNVTSNNKIQEASQKLNDTAIKPYIDAFSKACGKEITHNMILDLNLGYGYRNNSGLTVIYDNKLELINSSINKTIAIKPSSISELRRDLKSI